MATEPAPTRPQAVAEARALLAEWEMDLLDEHSAAPGLLVEQVREALSRRGPERPPALRLPEEAAA